MSWSREGAAVWRPPLCLGHAALPRACPEAAGQGRQGLSSTEAQVSLLVNTNRGLWGLGPGFGRATRSLSELHLSSADTIDLMGRCQGGGSLSGLVPDCWRHASVPLHWLLLRRRFSFLEVSHGPYIMGTDCSGLVLLLSVRARGCFRLFSQWLFLFCEDATAIQNSSRCI